MTQVRVSLRLVAHDPAVLERFGAVGEVRLVFARSDRVADVVLMPDGEAEAFRARAKAGEQFRCVVPDCDSPALSIVNRGRRRDGFSHRAGAGGHAPMGVAHLWSQLLIRDWLRDRYPDASVDLEVTTDDGRRRADVMFTSATGRQAAFEIQYAGITPAAWQARHDDYAARGILDIWLWGHLAPHFRTHRRGEGRVRLNPTLEAAAAAEQPILWINPTLSLIGFATQEVRGWNVEPHQLLATDGDGLFEAHALRDFRLTTEHGMTSDRLRYLLDTPARIEWDKERKRVEAEAAAERKKAALELLLTRMDELAAARAPEWARSPARARILVKAGGVWPPFLGLPTYLTGRVLVRFPIPAEEWQARLWSKHIAGQADGARVYLWKLKLDLERMHPDIRVAEDAAANWIGQLIDRGLIERKIHSYRNRKTYSWEVRRRGPGQARPVDRPEAPARPVIPDSWVEHEERMRLFAEAAAEDEAYERWFQGVTLIPLPLFAGPNADRGNVTASGAPACPACSGAMNDPDSQRLGYHARCAPAIEAKYRVTIAIRR